MQSSPWTHHLLQYQKTNLRTRYKRMTKTRVKLMRAIRPTQNIPPISVGGEQQQQQVTPRLKITGGETHSNLWLTQQTRTPRTNHVAKNKMDKIYLRQNATLVVTTAPSTQPHRPTCIISRCHDLVSEGTHELCLYHHNVQAQHFFQRYHR